MKTRLLTRTFLLCFLPFALLLTSSFWTIQRFVESTVRQGLHASLRDSQLAIANIHARGDLQNSRFLRIAGENSSLKAGMQLLLANPRSADARRTVEDQLRELGEHMGFDLMLVSAPDGRPLAGVSRQSGSGQPRQLVPLDTSVIEGGRAPFLQLGSRTFQVAAVPIDVDDQNIGFLSVGEYFDFTGLTTPAALLHDRRVLQSNLLGGESGDLENSLSACPSHLECDFRIRDANWIAMPMESYGDGYVLLSLQNVDEATAPIQSRLHQLFLTLATGCVLVALLCSFGTSNSIVKPVSAVVEHLRNAVRTGKLSELEPQTSSIAEIQELAEIYNQAAISLRLPEKTYSLLIFSLSGHWHTLSTPGTSTQPVTVTALVSSRARLLPRCACRGGMRGRFQLAVFLVLAIGGAAGAQEAPAGLDLRATVTAQTIASNELTREPRAGSPIILGSRSILYPTIKFSNHWFLTGAFQVESRPYFYSDLSSKGYGAKGQLLQSCLNYARTSDRGSLLVRAGQMSSAFGSFLLRYDDADNPLVDVPVGYGYYYAPVSFLGVFGAQVDASRGKFDGRLQFANSSPANPRSIFARDQYGNWAGGAGYTIRQGLRIGVSGYRGPYLDHHYLYYFPGEENPSKLPAHGLGIDGNWAHGHTTVYVELQKFVMPYTVMPDFRESAAYGEVRQVISPHWFVAGRYGYSSTNVTGKLHSIESAVAYRPNRFQLIKVAYEEERYVPGGSGPSHTLGVQLITQIDRSLAAR